MKSQIYFLMENCKSKSLYWIGDSFLSNKPQPLGAMNDSATVSPNTMNGKQNATTAYVMNGNWENATSTYVMNGGMIDKLHSFGLS